MGIPSATIAGCHVARSIQRDHEPFIGGSRDTLSRFADKAAQSGRKVCVKVADNCLAIGRALERPATLREFRETPTPTARAGDRVARADVAESTAAPWVRVPLPQAPLPHIQKLRASSRTRIGLSASRRPHGCYGYPAAVRRNSQPGDEPAGSRRGQMIRWMPRHAGRLWESADTL